MMTSRIGKSKGFTLLEVLITLAIVALFSGFFLIRFDNSRDEDTLREASTELKFAALVAKNRSFAFRRDQFILFDRGSYYLADSVSGSSLDPADGNRVIQIPSELSVEVMPFGETRWKPLQAFRWRFRDSGLNDPIGIRFSLGRSYSILVFDALTAIPDEETFIN